MKRIITVALAAILVMLPCLGFCELEGRASLDESLPGLRLYQQPKVVVPAGWHASEEMGQQLQCLVLLRVSEDPDNPLTMIYGVAVPKEGQSDTLQEFIRDDIETFKTGNSGVSAEKTAPFPSGKGPLTAYTFTYTYEGDRFLQTVVFAEEGDFFVTFTLTGKTAAAHDSALPDFKAVLGSYR